MARLIKIVFFILLPFLASAQTPTMTSKMIGPLPAYRGFHAGYYIPFLECLSADAKQTLAGTGFIGKKYPLIIGFHGIGERTVNYPVMSGMGTGDLSILYRTTLPSVLRYTTSSAYNKRYAAVGTTDSTSFCYAFPQVWQGASFTWVTYAYNMIKYYRENMSNIIDTSRIYIVGLSFGGGAVMVAMQDPQINQWVAGCFSNCAGYITYTGLSPAYNFQTWAEWGGITMLAHSTNDSTTDKSPITGVGSYYSDRANDSILKYPSRIGNLVYYRWITGGHTIWDRPYDPAVAAVNWPKSNSENANFIIPFQSIFLSYTTKGRRRVP